MISCRKNSVFPKFLQFKVSNKQLRASKAYISCKFYEQCGGVAMDFPLGPTLANFFMCHFENTWLENCPANFKPIVYRRLVDDTFLHFRTKNHVEKFKNYLKKQHKDIKFTPEI